MRKQFKRKGVDRERWTREERRDQMEREKLRDEDERGGHRGDEKERSGGQERSEETRLKRDAPAFFLFRRVPLATGRVPDK